jgi:hypothetical protein
MKTMKEEVAKARGYHALTAGYKLPDEQWMLENVRGDLQRGNISHALVKVNGGTAVWRTLRSATIRTGANGRAA